MTDKLPRAVRNNNPGNIDRSKTTVWNGELRTPEALASEARFCVFIKPEYGFRAIAITLQTYGDKYGVKTIRKIIERWAPDNENDTAAYIAAVSKSVGIGPDVVLDVRRLSIALPLVKAIAHHESGADYWHDLVIMAGLSMAGVKA